METPAICNGCGNASSAWDKLCNSCSQEITCQNCNKIYKRGQGLQEVNLCPICLREVFEQESPEEEEHRLKLQVTDPHFDNPDPYEMYGFDHQWELNNE